MLTILWSMTRSGMPERRHCSDRHPQTEGLSWIKIIFDNLEHVLKSEKKILIYYLLLLFISWFFEIKQLLNTLLAPKTFVSPKIDHLVSAEWNSVGRRFLVGPSLVGNEVFNPIRAPIRIYPYLWHQDYVIYRPLNNLQFLQLQARMLIFSPTCIFLTI